MSSKCKWVYTPDKGTTDICVICKNWQSFPELACEKCPNSYHKKCLDQKYHDPNSWRICPQIDEDIHCEKDRKAMFCQIEQDQNKNKNKNGKDEDEKVGSKRKRSPKERKEGQV